MLDFTKPSAGDIVDEAADGNGIRDPWMGAELLQLVADVFIDVLESVEEGRSDGGGSSAILDLVAQIVLGGVHQSAIGVIDDHKFLSAEKMMGDDERAQRVVGYDAAGVADDVGIAFLESQSTSGEAGIHAGEDGELALRARSQAAQLVGARVDLIGGENFVDDGHGGESLAKEKRVGSG